MAPKVIKFITDCAALFFLLPLLPIGLAAFFLAGLARVFTWTSDRCVDLGHKLCDAADKLFGGRSNVPKSN